MIEKYRYVGEDVLITQLINEVLALWCKPLESNTLDGIFEQLPDFALEMQKHMAMELERLLQCKQKEGKLTHHSAYVFTDRGQINTAGQNAILWVNVNMDKLEMREFSFGEKIMVNVSGHYAKFKNCHFRGASFLFCDFRCAEFTGGTFENSYIWWCDFYRAYFQGVIRFAKAKIVCTSMNSTYFAGGSIIRKTNFSNNRLLQQDKLAYSRFLILWDSIRPHGDKIRCDEGETGDRKIQSIVHNRYSELELIFKNLSSSFCSNGFSNDSNWAYIMGKKAEREVYWRRMSVSQLLGPECIQQCKLWQKWFVNKVYDAAFGYGESLWKICRTYLVVVFVFTFLYMYKGEIRDFIQAFIISFKNMAGMSSDEIVQRNDIVLNLLNLVQTTMGILITGIFGFILGNKIRNQ